MADNNYPELNGITPSWADLTVTCALLDGPLFEIGDIAGIDWSDAIEEGRKAGVGSIDKKRTTGKVTQNASITFYRDGMQVFQRRLIAVAPIVRGKQRAIGRVFFNVTIQRTPPNTDEIYETRLRGCRVMSREGSLAEGTDAEQVTVPLSIMGVVDIIDGQEVVLL